MKRQQLANTKRTAKYTYTDPTSKVAEQYQRILTNMEGAAHTVVVTSISRGAGTTTTVSNLAVALAARGAKTLLIDANLRHPAVHDVFTEGQVNDGGLTSVLSGKRTLAKAVTATGVKSLTCLTSGPLPSGHPANLFTAEKFAALLEEATQLYEYVLLDSPPILTYADAQIVANHCQGSILLLNSGETAQEAALQAKQLLTSAEAQLLGVILNKRTS